MTLPVSPTSVLRVLSLGAGVQSSTLYLMAVRGEFGSERPSVAIFSDTGAEPRAVYDWLDELERIGGTEIPIHRVAEGKLTLTQIIGRKRPTGKWRHMPIPAYISDENGKHVGLANRSCTRDFKLRPIRREVRRLLGIQGKRSPLSAIAEQWIGISRDEAHRMKDSREPWVLHRWPLIEREMTRDDCLAWMERRGYPRPPKSSCTFCPYHDKAAWNAVREDPAALAEAILVDETIRNLWDGRVPGRLYLHRSLQPLRIALSQPDTPGAEDDQIDAFGNECEGICGV